MWQNAEKKAGNKLEKVVGSRGKAKKVKRIGDIGEVSK